MTTKRVERGPGENRGIAGRMFQLFSSFALAIWVLTLLLLITLLGTIAQIDLGLHGAIETYFDPLFLIHWFEFGQPRSIRIPLPLPGGYLLMALLCLNMLCGAIIKARKSWRRPGMLLSHFSIIFMIIAGFVSFHWKREGNIALYEGETSNEFRSYHDWVVEIRDTSPDVSTALVIDQELFRNLAPGDSERTFRHPSLPFSLALSGYLKNTKPSRGQREGLEAEGFFLQKLAPETENERNLPGLVATAKGSSGEFLGSGLLWGGASHGWTVEADNRSFLVKLKRRSWKIPFALTLDKFTRELHPGTDKAKVFLSHVTKTKAGHAEQIEITMNEPLRQDGFTFFQASWGPENAKPGDRLYSVFAVVDNPSDMWPLYSCILVGVGLLIHFLQHLVGHLTRAARRREKTPAS
jgi:hypothetical protein